MNNPSNLRGDAQSVGTLSMAQSVSSQRSKPLVPPRVKTVVTAPPWARDEPPSPVEQDNTQDSGAQPRPSASTLSREANTTTSTTVSPFTLEGGSLWSAFAGKRHADTPPPIPQSSSSKRTLDWPTLPTRSPEKKPRSMRERSRDWLSHRSFSVHFGRPEGSDVPAALEERASNPWHFNNQTPPTPGELITLKHARTPGWNQPWSPRTPKVAEAGEDGQESPEPYDDGVEAGENGDARERSKWYRRRKRIRAYVLNNNYVPLIFRVTNITLTTAALIVAVHIRRTEQRFGIRGAIGSSPTLVIIFAPLTLVHVMMAIYLEYFGRPLGLWRTSMKLIHTLSETVFVCAWSAALSLCFDNFFTSVLQCSSASSTSWYDEIPREVPTVPHLTKGPGEPGQDLCNHQVALICLVGVGLLMYCSNLFISLFRIFEKVKYHTAALPSH